MSDTDYIRKAVELADGFVPEALQVSGTENLQVGFEEQFFLDALAAQLVRQVDALPEHGVHIYPWDTQVQWRDNCCVAAHGDICANDRTMNTIKAIVDSKVLDID